MKMKDKLISAGAVLLAFGGLGSAAAFASPTTAPGVPTKASVTKVAAPEPVGATDIGTTQPGDQTTPDVPGVAETPDPNEKPDSPTAGDTADSGAEAKDVTEAKDGTESGVDADGPGGHADPAGQVDNQQAGKN